MNELKIKFWKNILDKIIHCYKWCWKHDCYKANNKYCFLCIQERAPKPQQRGKNPTPRKCRGHKIKADVENGKCLRCGGKVG